MAAVRLDLGSFRDALGQLQTSLAYCSSTLARQDPGVAKQFESAAIQAFEFTYDIAHKMLRRWLLIVDPGLELEFNMAFQNLFREGYARGLVRSEWRTWSGFRQARNITSHTYNAKSARQVFEQIPSFVEEAQFLLAALDRNAQNELA